MAISVSGAFSSKTAKPFSPVSPKPARPLRDKAGILIVADFPATFTSGTTIVYFTEPLKYFPLPEISISGVFVAILSVSKLILAPMGAGSDFDEAASLNFQFPSFDNFALKFPFRRSGCIILTGITREPPGFSITTLNLPSPSTVLWAIFKVASVSEICSDIGEVVAMEVAEICHFCPEALLILMRMGNFSSPVF